jgi:hypothetical protein
MDEVKDVHVVGDYAAVSVLKIRPTAFIKADIVHLLTPIEISTDEHPVRSREVLTDAEKVASKAVVLRPGVVQLLLKSRVPGRFGKSQNSAMPRATGKFRVAGTG